MMDCRHMVRKRKTLEAWWCRRRCCRCRPKSKKKKSDSFFCSLFLSTSGRPWEVGLYRFVCFIVYLGFSGVVGLGYILGARGLSLSSHMFLLFPCFIVVIFSFFGVGVRDVILCRRTDQLSAPIATEEAIEV